MTGFLCRFAVIYGLLIIPWPGGNELYARYFAALGQMAFSREGEKREVQFVSHTTQHGFTTLTTQMIISNRDQVDQNGKVKALIVDLDTRSIGWVPTALVIALVLATPVPGSRRLRALFPGLLLVQGFILFSLQACIWNKSAELKLLTVTPFWKYLLDGLDYTLLTQMGASFSVPVLIWLLVTFRKQDLDLVR